MTREKQQRSYDVIFLTFLVPIPAEERNQLKFLFLHFFVVPQKVL